ncbi:unnamed protein product [Paramecium octaurelia]|uniref:CEP76 C2 domain-containing protein n=1 Tax=Paramecium octaurelia TaxID=43137 RepID=A0A8S1X7T1_PAROT|nr:unnamed protein product [Paramecium octaurelia]
MYSKEQITKIRQLINNYFDKGEVFDKLKKKIESEKIQIDDLDNEKLTKLLRETNLIDNLILDIKHLDELDEFNKQNKQLTFVDPDRINYRSVSLRIYKGRAFLDFIEPGNSKLQLYLSFCGQRFASATVDATVEPEFNELFLFDLRTEAQKANVDLLTLSKLDHPIELCVIQIQNGQTKLFSQKLIEWRFLLCYGNISLNIELPTTYNTKMQNERKNHVGILQIHLELLPKTGLVLLPENIVVSQLSKEKSVINQISDRFHTYGNAWWNDFKELKLSVRPIKLYSESQDGIWRPSCTFIRELQSVRGIMSPNHAARFVSLIPMKTSDRGPSGDRLEVWHRFPTFLALKGGDFEDHCLLLCSFFLGFNLDAFVVFGSTADRPHGWVMTRLQKPKKPNQKQAEYAYNFWEPLTGHKFELNDPKVPQLYKRIGCIFNHKCFYANIQENDSVLKTDLNIEDYTKWKAVDPNEISLLKPQNFQLTLLRQTIYADELEPKLELQLREAIGSYRKIINLATRYDEKLGSIMQIALANYETEKITGLQFAQFEFQSAIRSYIPEGHTFMSFPICFNHMNIQKMLEDIKTSPVGGEVLTARGDQTYHAVRVKMEIYPEDVYAVWVSVSVRFHKIV